MSHNIVFYKVAIRNSFKCMLYYLTWRESCLENPL